MMAPVPGGSRGGGQNILWTISATGRAERSRDGGQTWQDTTLDPVFVVRAIFTAGAEVWVGGTGGTLYHSTDGGGRWIRVTVQSGEERLAGDITSIDFPDSEHGAIRSNSRQEWSTSDGGQHWTRR